MNGEDRIGNVPTDVAKEDYSSSIANYLGVDEEKIGESGIAGKWAEGMKEFWKNPIENMEEAIEEHERKIKKYKQYIKKHKKAINTLETKIENLKIENEEVEV